MLGSKQDYSEKGQKKAQGYNLDRDWISGVLSNNIVHPTVFMEENGEMRRYGGLQAFFKALGDDDYIEFNTPEEADEFSRKYKMVWD